MQIEVDGERGPLVELVRAGDGDESALRAHARSLPPRRPTDEVSRSYCFPYALVGWHSDRIGVDIERVVACDQEFGRSICTPEELTDARYCTDEELVSLWCSKEALAKALGDPLRYDPRRLGSPRAWLGGSSGPWRAQAISVPRGYCAWVCWRRP